jgi:hypothetical protein
MFRPVERELRLRIHRARDLGQGRASRTMHGRAQVVDLMEARGA